MYRESVLSKSAMARAIRRPGLHARGAPSSLSSADLLTSDPEAVEAAWGIGGSSELGGGAMKQPHSVQRTWNTAEHNIKQ